MTVSRPSRPTSALARLLAAVALLAMLVPAVDTRLAPPPSALAANFLVNLASDPGDGTCNATCTLRDAILGAGALAGHDTITFSPAVTTPIVLASALPIIAQPLTIDGSGQAITVDGASLYRPLLATAPLTLTALTIQRGRGPNDGFGGGGAYFGSSGTLSGTSFISNTSIAVAFGAGGAYFAGSAMVEGGSFISNTATAGSGGGVYFAGAAVISGTAFLRNASGGHGGGLFAATTATVTNSTLISNTAAGDGGGAYFFGAASVTGSTFTTNRVAGSFSNSGGGAMFVDSGSLANASFTSNTAVLDGGGVRFYGAAAISGSQFTGNTSGSGGGAYLGAGGGLTNTTFVSNTALADGGGLYLGVAFANLDGPSGGDIVPISGATFTGNQALAGAGGGAYLAGPSAIDNSEFRGNTAATLGGGVRAVGDTTIAATVFLTNAAQSGGGGSFETASVVGASFVSNTATGLGGGGGARFTGSADIGDTTISGNTAAGDGGGARFDGGSVVTGASFTGNSTTGFGTHGGGAAFSGPAVVTGTTFLSNTAQNGNGGGWHGSAITATNTTLVGNQALCEDEQLAQPAIVTGPTPDCGKGGGTSSFGQGLMEANGLDYSGNTAAKSGGGLFARGAADNGISISGVVFEDNTAGEKGGGAYLEAAAGDWGRIELGDNEAGDDGGAIFLDQSRLELFNAVFFGNTVTNPDGAVDLSMSFSGSTLDAKHVTFGPRVAGFRKSISVGTDLPDEHGTQLMALSMVNSLFYNYDIGVQGQSPTSTVEMTGVLWSNVNTPWQIGIFSLQLEYTGLAGFVDEIGGDYHLTTGSDAINRGVVTEVTTDFDGNPRVDTPDLGAYEFQGDQSADYKIYLPIIMNFRAPFRVTNRP